MRCILGPAWGFVPLLLLCCAMRGQAEESYFSNTIAGSVPAALQPASPATAYELSGFDLINPYSGRLDVQLPLLRVGGRGEAGYTMTLPVSLPPWLVEVSTNVTRDSEFYNRAYVYFLTQPMPGWWNSAEIGYGPGTLAPSYAGEGLVECGTVEAPHLIYSKTFSHMVFRAPGGAEYALYDVSGQGVHTASCTPESSQVFDRGTKFVSRDGSGLTFEATVGITDRAPVNDSNYSDSPGGVSGTLMMPNGMVYDIILGKVMSIRDRNGNKVSFTYDGTLGVVTSITDSLGRTITVNYTPAGCTMCQEITYPGTGGTPRTIRVKHATIASRLRADQQPLMNVDVFPDLLPGYKVGDHGLTSISEVILSNGRKYEFYYNIYGEVARVVLPTGGAVEYDHGPGVAPGSPGVREEGQILDDLPGSAETSLKDFSTPLLPPWRPVIYRRLLERREYPEGGTTNPARTTSYARVETYSNSQTIDNHVYMVYLANSGKAVVTETGLGIPAPIVTEHSHLAGAVVAPPYGGPGNSLIILPTEEHVLGPLDQFEGKEHTWESPGLRKVERVFGRVNPVNEEVDVCQENTTLDGTATAARAFTYTVVGGGGSVPGKVNVAGVFEYDYGAAPAIAQHVADACTSSPPGGYIRQTRTEYKTDGGYVNALPGGVHLRSLPTRKLVCGAGTCDQSNFVAKAEYEYDIGTPEDRGSATGHEAAYGQTHATRGNVTAAKVWRDLPTGAWLTTRMSYDILGNVVSTEDPNGNTTAFGYTDNFIEGAPPLGQTYAFRTSTTYPIAGMTSSARYSWYLGRMREFTAANGDQTTLTYNDPLDRLKSRDEAGTRKTAYEYIDSSPPAVEVYQDLHAHNDGALHKRIDYDGLGRQAHSIQYEDGGQISGDTEYDGLGRVRRVSNPYRSGGPEWTTMTYDALNRVKTVATPDGAVTATDYSGYYATVTDPAGKARRNRTDGLGRLVEVTENPGGLNYITGYGYSVLDDLLSVTQGTQTRTFAYDSARRLICASNPESRSAGASCQTTPLPAAGLDRYSYDANGNLESHSNARGAVVTWDPYDALNRPTRKSYTGVTAPAVRWCYDGTTYSGGSCAASVVPGEKGFLTGVGNSDSASAYLHGPLGLVKKSSQTTGGVTYSFVDPQDSSRGYSYNAAGLLTGMWYPSGRSVSYTYDGTGRANAVTGYASGIQYTPHGAVSSMTLGNGVVETAQYNNRLQPRALTAARSGTLLSLGLEYGGTNNNGNVMSQTISFDGAAPVSQSYTYDGVNRLSAAGEGANWSRTYGHDRYGNRWVSASSGAPVSSFTPATSAWFDTATNRLVNVGLGIGYDSAGNLTGTGGYNYTYDCENRLKESTINSVTTSYAYDGEGRRVKKWTGAAATVYVYDAFGQLAAEYSSEAPGVTGRQYITADHLGSTRLVTDANGGVAKRYDYLPFGEELLAGIGGRTTGQGYNVSAAAFYPEFTSKERDAETGLDYFGARYFSGAQGRFTSPDEPFADQHPENPQSWNLYQYGYNNPLTNIDIDGRSVWSKAVKVVVKVAKTGNAAAGFADNIQDAATLFNPAASPLQRIGAGLSLASELLPVSVGDVKDAGRLLGVIDDAVDAGKQVVRSADDVADTGKKLEGIYEFSEKGKTYVGQSGDVAGRVGQHLESGKLVPGTTVTVTPVPGGKTAREVAEQKRINQLGGTANTPGSQTTNQRNPVGPKRQKRIEDEYGPLKQN
ncbi:MAG TPA: RHS repeat-associated core domain-containing protein [Bryobacteraceae bacterium]|nr:RHS repeat-associated core domain-containing protein [Bryobacteraceae bacterium]